MLEIYRAPRARRAAPGDAMAGGGGGVARWSGGDGSGGDDAGAGDDNDSGDGGGSGGGADGVAAAAAATATTVAVVEMTVTTVAMATAATGRGGNEGRDGGGRDGLDDSDGNGGGDGGDGGDDDDAAYPKGQCPPAGGRNRSRMAVCRAHSQAVPHTRLEHDQHRQRSLRWIRRPLQNDDLNIGLCEPRLRFMRAQAMQAVQYAAKWPSAPQKPTSIIGREMTNATNVSHVTTWPQLPHAASQRRRNKQRWHWSSFVSTLAQVSLGDITIWRGSPT